MLSFRFVFYEALTILDLDLDLDPAQTKSGAARQTNALALGPVKHAYTRSEY
jgi:hypothetical protein